MRTCPWLWLFLGALTLAQVGAGPAEATGTPAGRRTDAAGLTLILIPPGEFLMGSSEKQDEAFGSAFWRSAPPEEQDLQSEKPQHPVCISKAFFMSAHEITVGQFRRFVTATGYKTDAEKSHRGGRGFDVHGGAEHKGQFENGPQYTWRNPGFPQSDEHPVVLVSWNDAVAFTAWLSTAEKAVYRLPTEAEWEYACRAGTRTWLNFGDDPSLAPLNANLADGSLEKAHPGHVTRQRALKPQKEPEDGQVYTAPVGRFKPNAFGLFDMHGNVWEWCQDRYWPSAYKRLDAHMTTVDPQGPDVSEAAGPLRVLRGGSWYVDMVTARSSARLWNAPEDAFCYAGFRVVRAP
jgi:formylglycine-generating enzyme